MNGVKDQEKIRRTNIKYVYIYKNEEVLLVSREKILLSNKQH